MNGPEYSRADILQATSYDHNAGRKMLVRMRMAGELVSLARGLYTTANHPCLLKSTDDTPPVPNVPSVPSPQSPTLANSPQCDVSPVPAVPVTDHTTSTIPIVPIVPIFSIVPDSAHSTS